MKVKVKNNYCNNFFKNKFKTQGNYTSAEVDLSKNLLTRFEEGAFKSMLQDLPLFLSVVNSNKYC